MRQNLLLIKGYGPPHADRFQHHEEKIAKSAGLHVFYPQDVPDFVDGARPTVEVFCEFFRKLIQEAGLEPDRTIVLAHSLGGNGWLRILEMQKEMRECLTVLIGTPFKNKTGLDEIADFFPNPKLNLTREQRRNILVVGSDNDRVIHERPSVLARRLQVEHVAVPGAGHFMPAALHQKRDEMDLGKEWSNVRGSIGRRFLPY
ncbi:hypothetical protein COV82_04935 [Candidatus Peregrinibacteria bacterium CG11_big_fil_rev_8_21_14_0_20_46_8]|nr:MAG: hypothetical protein COV82_04935 [Candidatus Peregrinibacteria bacterium CG11_big_fil_rev_8_21_14_0_20_46_8]